MYRIIFMAFLATSNCFWWRNYDDYDNDYDMEDQSVQNHEVDWIPNVFNNIAKWASDDDCEREDRHDWHSTNDKLFLELSSYMIKADEIAQTFCKRYTNCDVKELRGTSEYEIVYTLPQCHPNHVTVKIKHRVLYMYARKSTGNSDKYFDLRILPDLLKTADATWKCVGNALTVTIPYDVRVQSKILQEKTCFEVNEGILNVPKAPNLQYKYGK